MDKDVKQLRTTLVQLLEQELGCAKSLFLSLQSECKALSTMDDKLITINSARKLRLIDTLQSASDARVQFMEEHGITASPAAIDEHIISKSGHAELNQLFIELSEMAQRCFVENRLIGQLINRRSQFISRTLSCLSPAANLQSLTYGENGTTDHPDDSQNSLFYLAKI